MEKPRRYGIDPNTAMGILNCPEDEPYHHRLNAYRYMYQSITGFERDRRFAGRRALDNRMNELFEELMTKLNRVRAGETIHIHPPDPYIIAELFDIATMFLPTLADRIRDSGILDGVDANRVPQPLPLPQYDPVYGIQPQRAKRVYYQDSQNVHDARINASMLGALRKLRALYHDLVEEFITHYPAQRSMSRDDIESILIQDAGGVCTSSCAKYSADIKTLTQYVLESIACYEDVTLRRAFLYIYLFIQSHDNKQELFIRLGEESKSARGLCTTGHYTRLLNVIQGFTDDPDLQIKVVDDSEYKGNVIDAELQTLLEADPDLLLDMTEQNEPYQHLLQTYVQRKNGDPVVINHLVKKYRFVR